jgi:hypothetical protein
MQNISLYRNTQVHEVDLKPAAVKAMSDARTLAKAPAVS